MQIELTNFYLFFDYSGSDWNYFFSLHFAENWLKTNMDVLFIQCLLKCMHKSPVNDKNKQMSLGLKKLRDFCLATGWTVFFFYWHHMSSLSALLNEPHMNHCKSLSFPAHRFLWFTLASMQRENKQQQQQCQDCQWRMNSPYWQTHVI